MISDVSPQAVSLAAVNFKIYFIGYEFLSGLFFGFIFVTLAWEMWTA
jgi:hypothetical protein